MTEVVERTEPAEPPKQPIVRSATFTPVNPQYIAQGPFQDGDQVITATWDAVDGATEYKPQWWGLDGRRSWQDHPLGALAATPSDTQSIVLDGIPRAHLSSFWIRIKAVNSAGESGWSGYKQFTPVSTLVAGQPVPTQAPGVIAGSRPTVMAGQGRLAVRWEPPADTGGAAVESLTHDLRYGTGPPSVRAAWPIYHVGAARSVAVAGLHSGVEYQVQVRARNDAGVGVWSDVAKATPQAPAGKAVAATAAFALEPNVPNPFNPTTTIRYALPHAADVELTVYNVVGQAVRTLVAAYQSAGRYAVEWDATDDSGHSVSAGLYFYRLQAGGQFHAVEKMLLLK